jgi:hypothetical protein
MGFLGPTQEEEEDEEEEEEEEGVLTPRNIRCARCSNLHLTLLFLLPITAPDGANNALATASHLAVRDGATPIDVAPPSPTLDITALSMVLALLAITYGAMKHSADTRTRLMKSVCAAIADHTQSHREDNNPNGRMFRPIDVEDVNGVGYRTRGPYGIGFHPRSALLDEPGYQPYSVDITATFTLLGRAFEWIWYAPGAPHAMAIAPLIERARGFDGVNARQPRLRLSCRW